MATQSPEARIKIIAENLARAALGEVKRDVQGLGQAGTQAADATKVSFGKMVFAHGELIASSASARRGAGVMRNAIQQLAFQAAAIPGPFGRLISGFLTIGGGGGVALLAAAAVGSVALAIRGLTADSRESKRAQDELIQSLKGIGEHGKVTSARIRIAQLEQVLTAPNFGERVKMVGSALLGPAFGGASIAEQRERIKREIAKLRGEMGNAGTDLEAPGREALRAASLEIAQARIRESVALQTGAVNAGPRPTALDLFEKQRQLALSYDANTQSVAAEVAARERLARKIELNASTMERAGLAGEEATLRRKMIGASALAILEQLQIRELIRQGVDPGVAEATAMTARKTAASLQTTDILRTMGPQLAVQSLLAAQQGGGRGFAQAFFPGAAGLAAALPGVGPFGAAGLQLTGDLLGKIFGRNGEQERRHREELEELRRIRENTDKRGQPDHVSVTVLLNGKEVSTELLGQVMYGIRRAERRNARPVLPPG